MGRPVALNQTAPQSNALQQLTRMTVVQGSATKFDYECRFSASQNDGRITQRKDWVSGE